MHNVTSFSLNPDQDRQLRSTNQKIAVFAANSPGREIQSAFTFAAELAMEALATAAELKRMPGIERAQVQKVVDFWYSLADHARTAALACVGGAETLAEATVAFLFLQTSSARKPASARTEHEREIPDVG